MKEVLRCPECLSHNIVYDNKRGDIICGNCGLIIDRIYEAPIKKAEHVQVHDRYLRRKYRKDITLIYRRISRYNLIVKPIVKNLRRGLKIRDDIASKIINGEEVKMVKTIVKVSFEEVLKNISSSQRETLHNIVTNVLNNYPRLASRTDRVKMALAQLLYDEVVMGRRASILKIARSFKVDPINLRRAYMQAKQYRKLQAEIRNTVLAIAGGN